MTSIGRLTKFCLQYATSRIMGEGAGGSAENALVSMGGPVAMKVGQISTAGDADSCFFEKCDKPDEEVVQLYETLVAEIKQLWPLHCKDTSWLPDKTPIAIASIGCVFLGKHPVTGIKIVWKVHGESESEQLRRDLQTFKSFSNVLSTFGLGVGKAAETLANCLDQELDYVLEAKQQENFRSWFCGNNEVYVPKAFPELGSASRLCSQAVQGARNILLWAREPGTTQEQRNKMGLALAHIVYRPVFEHGVMYSDLHPGNFLVDANGRLALVDFGCVYTFENDEVISNVHEMHSAVRDKKPLRLHKVCIKMGFFKHDTRNADVEEVYAYFDKHMEPYVQSKAFTFSKEWASERSKHLPSLSWSLPASIVFFTRVTYGLNQILAALQATGDFSDAIFGANYERNRLSNNDNPSPTKFLSNMESLSPSAFLGMNDSSSWVRELSMSLPDIE